MTTANITNDNSNPQQGASFRGGSNRVPSRQKDERKLFVGGLPGNITEVEFKEFFEQFGSLVDSVVMFDRETRRSRGFGFVTFQDPMVCRRLLMMGNEGADPENAMNLVGRLEMQGKVCEVKSATPKGGNGGGNRNRRHNGGESTNSDPYHGPRPGRFDAGPPPPQLGPPVMHYPYGIPAQGGGVYYPPPFMHHPGYGPVYGVEYPPYTAPPPHPVAPVTPVPPVPVEPYAASNPQHGHPFAPVIGHPFMPSWGVSSSEGSFVTGDSQHVGYTTFCGASKAP